MSDGQQIMSAIEGLTEQVRIQNGRVAALEVWKHASDKRFDKIETITDQVDEIVGFTRTTGKIAKWVSAVCGAGISIAGVIAVVSRIVS